MTADTSTATTRAHLEATAVVNCLVLLPKSTTFDEAAESESFEEPHLSLDGVLAAVGAGGVCGIENLPTCRGNLVQGPDRDWARSWPRPTSPNAAGPSAAALLPSAGVGGLPPGPERDSTGAPIPGHPRRSSPPSAERRRGRSSS